MLFAVMCRKICCQVYFSTRIPIFLVGITAKRRRNCWRAVSVCLLVRLVVMMCMTWCRGWKLSVMNYNVMDLKHNNRYLQ